MGSQNSREESEIKSLIDFQSPDIPSARIAGVLLDIEVELEDDRVEDDFPRITKNTDESYSLRISYDHPQRTITAR